MFQHFKSINKKAWFFFLLRPFYISGTVTAVWWWLFRDYFLANPEDGQIVGVAIAIAAAFTVVLPVLAINDLTKQLSGMKRAQQENNKELFIKLYMEKRDPGNHIIMAVMMFFVFGVVLMTPFQSLPVGLFVVNGAVYIHFVCLYYIIALDSPKNPIFGLNIEDCWLKEIEALEAAEAKKAQEANKNC